MTITELRDIFVDHYEKLYTVNVGDCFIVFSIGIIIEVTQDSVMVYNIPKDINYLMASLMTDVDPESWEAVGLITEIKAASKGFVFEMVNPKSVDVIDNLITMIIRDLIERKQEKWALR
jgi:hypothetical protein